MIREKYDRGERRERGEKGAGRKWNGTKGGRKVRKNKVKEGD